MRVRFHVENVAADLHSRQHDMHAILTPPSTLPPVMVAFASTAETQHITRVIPPLPMMIKLAIQRHPGGHIPRFRIHFYRATRLDSLTQKLRCHGSYPAFAFHSPHLTLRPDVAVKREIDTVLKENPRIMMLSLPLP